MKKLALIIILLHLLLSCGAERLHQKAVKKGYVHTIEVDTIKVPYLVVKNIKGEDSLIYRDSLVTKIVDNYIPRWKVRFDNKRFNDSLKYIRKVYRDSLKAEIKMHDDNLEAKIKMHDDSLKAEIKIEKQNTKQSKKPNIWLFVIGFLLGLITHFLFKFSKFNL